MDIEIHAQLSCDTLLRRSSCRSRLGSFVFFMPLPIPIKPITVISNNRAPALWLSIVLRLNREDPIRSYYKMVYIELVAVLGNRNVMDYFITHRYQILLDGLCDYPLTFFAAPVIAKLTTTYYALAHSINCRQQRDPNPNPNARLYGREDMKTFND